MEKCGETWARRPLASASGSSARGLWVSMVLGVPTFSTLYPHKNPKRQVILTFPSIRQ